jgi:hypothetical protein
VRITEFQEYDFILNGDIESERKSTDVKVNKYGRDLIEFCKTFACYIVNGRFNFHDTFTFTNHNGSSTVDYYITSKQVLDSVQSFIIGQNTESQHFPIILKLKSSLEFSDEISMTDKVYYNLNEENSNIYSDHIHECITSGNFDNLDRMLNNVESNINSIVTEFESAIFQCSSDFKKLKRYSNSKNRKRWFDKECRISKAASRKQLKRYRLNRNDRNLNTYLNSKNEYKSLCKRKRLVYDRKYTNKVESSVSNPRMFWREIGSVLNKPNVHSRIPIDRWFDHFSGLFSNGRGNNHVCDETCNDANIDGSFNEIENLIFNSVISDDEILQSVKELKLNKASGGNLIPQHLVYGINALLPFINRLFNRLFALGEFPESWAKSVIIPLHKKGSYTNPNNYRGIALLDVLSKLYISILTHRLTFYTEAYKLLSETQAGFRAGYTTIDNAFILYSVVQKYFSFKRKPVYVAFIDFQKAFDSVDRSLLYHVLSRNGVKGHLYTAIQSIYSSVKACVRENNVVSNVFDCPVGLRQGCSLSPILFALFINELHDLLASNNTRGIQLFPNVIEIFMLMFADDIALISDTISGLQRQLNLLGQFCEQTKLVVNIAKTKVLVFKRGGAIKRSERWYYNGNVIEIVNGFTYVGIYFSNRLSLFKMADVMSVKAKKVLLYLIHSFKHLPCLPYKMFFKVFDAKISSIMLYGSEIWGLKSPKCIEDVQMYACKRFLNVDIRSCNDAIVGDLGRFPMYIFAHKRCIKYWLRLLQMPKSRYIRLCYDMLMYYDSQGHENWVTEVRNELYRNGFGYAWESQSVVNPKLFILQYVQKLKDQFIQTWHSRCMENAKLNFYVLYKNNFNIEKYVTAIDIDKFRRCYASFRSSSHSLMIERGRHYSVEREHRVCPYCEITIEDEFHFLLMCPLYTDLRKKYIPMYYVEYPTIDKFCNLICLDNTFIIRNIAMFIFHSLKLRREFLEGFD